MTKFDPSTRLLARQALREAVREWPGSAQDAASDAVAEANRAWEERISRAIGFGEPDELDAPAAVRDLEPGGTHEVRRRLPSIGRLLLGVLALAFGVGLAWVATARLRRG